MTRTREENALDERRAAMEREAAEARILAEPSLVPGAWMDLDDWRDWIGRRGFDEAPEALHLAAMRRLEAAQDAVDRLGPAARAVLQVFFPRAESRLLVSPPPGAALSDRAERAFADLVSAGLLRDDREAEGRVLRLTEFGRVAPRQGLAVSLRLQGDFPLYAPAAEPDLPEPG